VTPRARKLILASGLVFCAIFTLMTVVVTIDNGLDPFTLVSFVIVAMVGTGLWGAIRTPPDE
jgi:hypothetical protein